MKKIVIGILAHVDAGKTTLSEGMLYKSGSIRKMGRVDNGDAFLDTFELEKARGITIFSKQAVFEFADTHISLLDTPGHVDFSAEMERTLQVLDYAILVISGADGVQGHTLTLWHLLLKYKIPVFLFINKMDQNGTDKEALLTELKKRLDLGCMEFGEFNGEQDKIDTFNENIAISDEVLLNHFLETGEVQLEEIQKLILERRIFPCYFGSALKLQGVEEFLRGIDQYTVQPTFSEEFGAKVFKIARDEQDNRLTYLKITGGNLQVKTLLSNHLQDMDRGVSFSDMEKWEEKVNQIRIYSGEKYSVVNQVEAGCICAVTGLNKTFPGQGLGIESETNLPLLEPVLTYQVLLPEECDPAMILPKLRELQEEEPQLHITWNETLQEIQVQIMGEVQLEILKSLILQRFGIEVEFGSGDIVYKETIEDTVEGVGHFEPLRHYAEVHLLMEPGKRGSGLQFAANCSEDVLDRNWQRLVLSHLDEKEHKGVLTGSSITDMKITLVSGRSHQKHTEGGDFRQATYRAVRQGLKQAKSILLEPYYEFYLEVPEQYIGRAMSDIEKMYGTFQITQTKEGTAILTGTTPVVTMRDYQKEVIAYTKGFGRLFCTLRGYEPCHNAQAVVDRINYDAERDLDNPTGSVFCAQGAGFVVSWDQVHEYMHLDSMLTKKKEVEKTEPIQKISYSVQDDWIDEEEIEAILAQTYYANKRDKSVVRKGVVRRSRNISTPISTRVYKKPEPREEYLLVDGYNIIFAWKELKEITEVNMDSAKDQLLDILCNYQGIKGCHLMVVFDAYKLKEHPTEILAYHNIQVVYTKEGQTADQYIERFVYEFGDKYHITVATSDGLEQIIIRGKGARLLSARELKEEINLSNEKLNNQLMSTKTKDKNYLFDTVSEDVAKQIDNIRKKDE